ncbi:hypothetical protein AVEN_215710-1 [Araneus ventricosus]|uniref:Uncharacterized protein n=1 Tax=Araneus ventricosus TaxID=182803 RepID=A0A4Y2AP05_ARAVE|nr:hypothetical protein AVEN_215710-1 [Araneus ventricosus]
MADLQWNRVSNTEPFSSEVETLPLVRRGQERRWKFTEITKELYCKQGSGLHKKFMAFESLGTEYLTVEYPLGTRLHIIPQTLSQGVIDHKCPLHIWIASGCSLNDYAIRRNFERHV